MARGYLYFFDRTERERERERGRGGGLMAWGPNSVSFQIIQPGNDDGFICYKIVMSFSMK